MSKYESYGDTSSPVLLTQGYVSSSDPLPPATPVVYSTQPIMVYPNQQAYPANPVFLNSAGNHMGMVDGNNPNPRPVPGTWKDGICDWPKNLYPSCYCACCCYGLYIIAQMAHKLQNRSFKVTICSFVVIWVVSMILQIAVGNSLIAWIPFIYVLSLAIGLRLYIVFKENINSNGGAFCECCIAFWCFPCSVAQMARHVYGYTKLFDGDGDIDRPDNFAHNV